MPVSLPQLVSVYYPCSIGHSRVPRCSLHSWALGTNMGYRKTTVCQHSEQRLSSGIWVMGSLGYGWDTIVRKWPFLAFIFLPLLQTPSDTFYSKSPFNTVFLSTWILPSFPVLSAISPEKNHGISFIKLLDQTSKYSHELKNSNIGKRMRVFLWNQFRKNI